MRRHASKSQTGNRNATDDMQVTGASTGTKTAGGAPLLLAFAIGIGVMGQAVLIEGE